MRLYGVLLATFTLVASASQASAAASFVCPTRPLEGAQAAKVKLLLPTGDAFDNVEQLDAAVDKLKADGVSPLLVIDNLIAAYCPVVAARSQWTDAQKSQRVNRFAARVTRTVFSLDDADEIILDVAFPPSVVDAINAKASAAKVSPEAWIQGAVTSALK